MDRLRKASSNTIPSHPHSACVCVCWNLERGFGIEQLFACDGATETEGAWDGRVAVAVAVACDGATETETGW